MISLYQKHTCRKIAWVLLISFVIELVYPTAAFALTSGPSQPEFSSFEPVSSSNMVDEFSGDFTYNLPVITIPGPQGSSYPMSLSYHSGTTPEEEASWVGYGWSLNPGAINRNTRGIPDDYKGGEVEYYSKMPANWTVTAGGSVGVEAFSKDGASLNAAIRYNNYRGFGFNAGANVNILKGLVSVGLGVSESGRSYSLDVSPLDVGPIHPTFSLTLEDNVNGPTLAGSISTKFNAVIPEKNTFKFRSVQNRLTHSAFTFSEVVRPTPSTKFDGANINLSVGAQIDPLPTLAGFNTEVFGSFSWQKNVEMRKLSSYGYLYSSYGKDKKVISDYYSEKETPYSKRDVILSIPFNNADNFIVTGEGVGGGFRLYQKEIGQFYPNSETSIVGSINVKPDSHIGILTYGGGAKIGAGVTTLTDKAWNDNLSEFKNDKDESVFFRFNNDLGGSVNYDQTSTSPISNNLSNDNPIQADLKSDAKGYSPSLAGLPVKMNTDTRVARSSYIGYHTNKEVIDKPFRVYSHRQDINNKVPRSLVPDGVGELTVFNTSGMRYLYGLPVYVSEEQGVQYGVVGAKSTEIENNFLVYKDDGKTKLGEKKNIPYAPTFLLTEITTPDYVDRTMNGASVDDLGGYTRFNYTKPYSLNSPFYWRQPYRGLMYNRGSLSDPLDDKGSVSSGKKEIYYVQSVETKTHVAIFTTSDRLDGKDAAADALTNKSAKGIHALQRLDKIDLYAIEDTDLNLFDGVRTPKSGKTPLKTVHFQYSYNLCKNLPNTSGTVDNSGKLTLEKVWFEYYGIAESKISPYVFEYKYPDYTQYPAKYAGLKDGYELTTLPLANQNPNYSFFNLDAWGNYQYNGQARYLNFQNWVEQNPEASFDPAAWQLKVIKLPSGGEIHIQYEQDDYAYVQDKEAHVLRSLDLNSNNGKSKGFYLKSPAGETSADRVALVNLINRLYGGDNKMYFKFLYNLYGDAQPEFSNCRSEYLTGYVTVKASLIGDKVYLDLGSSNTTSNHELPYQVCEDFFKTQRIGKLSSSGNCDPASAGISNEGSGIELVRKILNLGKAIRMPASICAKLNPQYSYFKIPTIKDKKGGGIRVKRLLTFDKGVDGEAVLYGNEYIYKTTNANGKLRSSGVATNEPSGIREENALVGYMPRKGQSGFSKIIAGIDKKQMEGPLGESILPAPSVGYSMIIVKNIHSGKTSPGFSVKEFYTAKDFPMKVISTEIKKQPFVLPLYGIFVNSYTNKIWATQGFSFIIHDMHGKPKREATYAGNYDSSQGLAGISPITEQVIEYYKTGEQIPVVNQANGSFELSNPGKETDITYANRSVINLVNDASVEWDAAVTIIPLGFFVLIIPQSSFFPYVNLSDVEFHTHTTSKVVRYPGIVKKVRSYADGIYHTDEYLAFDKGTGNPVRVKSYDEFAYTSPTNANQVLKGAYLKQDVMAAWEYPAMGGKYLNENKTISTSANFVDDNGKNYIQFTGTQTEVCKVLLDFTPGDLLELPNGTLPNGTPSYAYYHADEIDYANNRLRVYKLSLSSSYTNGTISKILIAQSGRTNELSTTIGSTTYHSENGTFNLPFVPNTSDQEGAGIKSFTVDLNTAIGNLSNTSQSAEFTLPGTYEKMNMTAYSSKVPSSCRSQLESAKIMEVKFRYTKNNTNIKMEVASFKVECGSGNWILVK